MLVRLKRLQADEHPTQRGRWAAYRSAPNAPTVVMFTCPLCGCIGSVGGAITADGHVGMLASCSSGLCATSFQLFLEGWAEMRCGAAAPPSLSPNPRNPLESEPIGEIGH